MTPIGIDDMAFYAPKLYLDIRTLAAKRDIPYEKLSQGLGLLKMAVCDTHEDAATMAAEAIAELIERNHLDPRQIGRIYLGTESALDMAKPTGTYAVEMLSQRFSKRFGSGCFRHCDVLDMTFACIGAADALQNTLDWVGAGRDRFVDGGSIGLRGQPGEQGVLGDPVETLDVDRHAVDHEREPGAVLIRDV